MFIILKPSVTAKYLLLSLASWYAWNQFRPMYMVNRKKPMKNAVHIPLSVPPMSVMIAVYPRAAAITYRVLAKKCFHVRDNKNSITTYAAVIRQKRLKCIPLIETSFQGKIKLLAKM